MKLSRSASIATILAFGLLGVQGCALLGGGQQQQEEELQQDEDDEEDDQDENLDQDDEEGNDNQEEDNFENQNEEEGNQEGNLNLESNNLGVDNMENQANDGLSNIMNQGVNDLAGDSMMDNNNMALPDNGMNTNVSMPNDAAMGSEMEDLNAMMNGMNGGNGGMDPSVGNPNVEANMSPGMNNANPAQSSPAPPMAAPGQARVYFVVAGGAELKDAPNGNTIQNLTQGDSCLVTVEGEWANMINRGYVSLSRLSMDPVGREISQPGWN